MCRDIVVCASEILVILASPVNLSPLTATNA
jgi:hypothetical protein